MIELCIYNHLSYLTCITFHETTPAESKHVCNVFPVMLGSELDRNICRQRGVDIDYRPINSLFIIDGAETILPFILTNRKEMGHKTKKNKESIFCLYLYDLHRHGYKISMTHDHQLVFRDCRGETVEAFDSDVNFGISNKHLDMANMKSAFLRMYKLDIDIDSLQNKYILSPTNILSSLITLAQKRPEPACEYIARGYIQKFASNNITFAESKKPKYFGDTSGSCNYRKIQPSQFNRPGVDRMCIRLVAKNVPKSVITDTDHFMCLYQKNVTIDSFNSTMLLLPSTTVCDENNIIDGTLDTLLDDLLSRKLIRQTINVDDENEELILVNGGMMTKYSAVAPFAEIFKATKRVNQLIEVIHDVGFYLFNLTSGIPFIPLPDNTMVSPIEFNRYFKDLKETSNMPIFGTGCSEDTIDYAQYGNKTKTMVAIGYRNYRFGSITGAKKFKHTSENNCVYIHDDEPMFDRKDEIMNMNIIFSSHPQVTADGYALSKDSTFKTTGIQRTNFDVTLPPHAKIEFLHNLDAKNCIIDRDNLGNVICKYLCIGKVVSAGEPVQITIFPQKKFLIQDNCYIYKIFDEIANIDCDFHIETLAVKTLEKNRAKIYYEFIATSTLNFMDGTKLSNPSSQKGIAVLSDLSRIKKRLGVKIDVVGSIFSVIGRSSWPQLKGLAKRRIISKKHKRLLVGVDKFDVLKNQSSTSKSCSFNKCDLYTLKVMETNGLPISIHGMNQRGYARCDKNKFLPQDRRIALSNINSLRATFEFKDTHGNSFVDYVLNEFDDNV